MDFLLISIITPIYNGSSYLDYAVKSVLNQKYPHWELFIIDDGSSDDSYEKAVRWSKKDKRIRVFSHLNHENRGVSATRNLGIRHAKGEYLAFLDCDDEWLPEKLEKQIDVIRKYPETIMVYSQAELIDEVGEPLSSNAEKLASSPYKAIEGGGRAGGPFYVFNLMADSNKIYVPCSTVLARKKEVLECGGFDETLKYQIEDSLLFALLAERGPVFFFDEILARYRFHNNSWSGKVIQHKTIGIYLEYSDKLLKAVKPEHRKLCSQELINRWARSVIGPGYWHLKQDISIITSTFLWVLHHKNVRLKDKIRSVWILTRWIGWKLFLKKN